MVDVTWILGQIEAGDAAASSELLPLVYEELRQVAAARLAQERPGQTLQATALVHEAYVRLVRSGPDQDSWNSRAHFFAAAAEAMRRILIENARRKQTLKRGGELKRIDLQEFEATLTGPSDELLTLNEALEQFEAIHPRKAALVKLRFFAGMTIEEAAQVLEISRSTAQRDWEYARCWLEVQIEDEPG